METDQDDRPETPESILAVTGSNAYKGSRVYTAAFLSMTRSRAGLKYDDSPQIPFALAIAFGAAVSGAEVLLKFKMPWSGYV